MTPSDMDDRGPHDRIWRESQDVYTRYLPSITAADARGADYGQLAIRSLLILNGGALFVLPAFLGTIHEASDVVDRPTLVLAGGLFIAGIVFALASAFVAYINYHFQSANQLFGLKTELAEIEEGYDDTHLHRLAKQREVYFSKMDTGRKRFVRLINTTAVVSHITGLLSVLSFIVGCYYSGVLMMQQTPAVQ